MQRHKSNKNSLCFAAKIYAMQKLKAKKAQD
jgi:hypothetical protein